MATFLVYANYRKIYVLACNPINIIVRYGKSRTQNKSQGRINMEYNGLTIAGRVQIGINYLEQIDKNWLDKISIDSLDMGDARLCILGQMPSGFSDMSYRLRQLGYNTSNTGPNSFCENTDFDFGRDDLEAMRVEWIEHIKSLTV